MYNLKIIFLIFWASVSQALLANALHVAREPFDGSRSLSGEIAIHFPVNQSRLMTDYSGNANSLMLLDRLMNDKSFYFDIDSIIINGYASPEGSVLHNSRLSFERARAVKDHIARNYPHVNSNKIVAVGRLVDLEALVEIIDNDLSAPFRSEGIDVLERTGISDIDRLSLLKDVGGGALIQHITRYYASSLRSATGIMFYRASDRLSVVDTLIINNPADTVFISTPGDTVFISTPGDTVFVDGKDGLEKPLFAVKTNLLFDVVTAVNLELEVPLGSRFSVLGEYVFPWWLIEHSQYCLQAVNANLELRYWFGNRHWFSPLTGWFAGVYGGFGYYDIEWGDRGYQGEFSLSTGLTAGYAHKIGRRGNFRMEYSLGAGYFNTDYHEYKPVLDKDDDWHLTRLQSGNYTWIGPTRLKVSLVWMLNRKK